MKKSISIVFSALIFLSFAYSAHARVLPRYSVGAKKTTSSGSSVIISPKLRSDRKALNVYFGNLNKATGVSYTLIYQTNGRDEGVSGSLDSSAGNNLTRELLFGTCSAGVCRYHQGISNMKLEITTQLKTGKKLLRRFKVRV